MDHEPAGGVALLRARVAQALYSRLVSAWTGLVCALRPSNWGQSHAYWVLFSLLTGLALGLLWLPPLPPLVDSPSVAYSGVVLHALRGGDPFFSAWYEARPDAVSHLAFYHAYGLLLFVLSPVASIKLITSVAVIALPLCMRALLSAMGRSAWLSLAGFGLAFNLQLAMGYLPFCLSIPLLPLCLAWVERSRDGMSWWRVVALFFVLAVSPYFHMLMTLLLFASVTFWVVLSQRSFKRVLVHFGVLAAATAAVVWIVPKPVGHPPRQVAHAVGTVTYSAHLDRFDGDFLNWTIHGWDTFSTPLFLAAVFATLSLTAGQGGRVQGASLWRRFCEYRSEMLAFLLFAGYMFAPTSVHYPWVAWSIDSRLTVFFGIFLVSMPRMVPSTMSQALRFAPVVVFSFFHLVSLVSPFLAFARATRGLVEVSKAIPAESTILPVFSHEYMQDAKRWRFDGFHGFLNQHLVRWSAVLSGGLQPYSFCDLSFHPLICTKQLPMPGARNPMPGVAAHAKHYEYVVLYANVPAKQKDHRGLVEKQGFEMVEESGEWTLWKRKEKE